MDLSALAQVGTMVLAALAIVWHQQRSNDKLRDDMSAQITGVRDELRGEITGVRDELRDELRGEIGGVRDELTGVRDELRDELRGEIGGVRGEIIGVRDELRDELRGEIGGVRDELTGVRDELGTVRSIVVENGQRLARIEGYLGIGMPSEAATAAAGARVAQQAKLPSTEEASEAP
ncbi:hypothetical protein [Candidatus Poriferisodalis sp.]|uniref:hypothetical protein n=1 Tax=Candidatus Poriferisodalis sp. TaxID=3101277 RepID=UPI003AF5A564